MFTRKGIIIHPEEFNAVWLDRVESARLNVLGLHPVGGKMAHNSLESAIAMHNLPEYRALRKEAGERGIQVEYEAHVMAWLLPRALFDRVPAWFRMNEKGDRVADFNLCPSNGDALDYIEQRTVTLARQLDTGATRNFLWMDDVAGFSCHCPECARLTTSEQQLRVANAMLRGLRRVNPTAMLCYIAYSDAMAAPRRVQPLDGIFLEYAPIRRDSHRPLDDANSAENVKETASLQDLIACFGKKNAQVLEYWMDNSRFSGWQKPPKLLKLEEEVMRRDLEMYDKLGFESITSFGCYLGDDYQALYGEPPVQAYGDILNARRQR